MKPECRGSRVMNTSQHVLVGKIHGNSPQEEISISKYRPSELMMNNCFFFSASLSSVSEDF